MLLAALLAPPTDGGAWVTSYEAAHHARFPAPPVRRALEVAERQDLLVDMLVEQGRFSAALGLARSMGNPDPADPCDAEVWSGALGQDALERLAPALAEVGQFDLALKALGAMTEPPPDEHEASADWADPMDTATELVPVFHAAGRLPALMKVAGGDGEARDALLLEVVATLSAAGDHVGARKHVAEITDPTTRVRALVRLGAAKRAKAP